MNALNALERKKKTIGACKLSILPKDSQSARKTYVYILSLLAKNESGGFAMQESSNVSANGIIVEVSLFKFTSFVICNV